MFKIGLGIWVLLPIDTSEYLANIYKALFTQFPLEYKMLWITKKKLAPQVLP